MTQILKELKGIKRNYKSGLMIYQLIIIYGLFMRPKSNKPQKKSQVYQENVITVNFVKYLWIKL